MNDQENQTGQEVNPPLGQGRLLVPRHKAAARLEAQIRRGIEIEKSHLQNQLDLEHARQERDRWSSYNRQMLELIFDHISFSEEYAFVAPRTYPAKPLFTFHIKFFKEEVAEKVNRLQAICERLELIPLSDKLTSGMTGRNALLVGINQAAVAEVTNLLEGLGLQTIALFPEADNAKPLAERINEWQKASLAVLCLPADQAQEMIYALGALAATIASHRLYVLAAAEATLPKEARELTVIRDDAQGSWRFQLTEVLRQSGVAILGLQQEKSTIN